MDLGTMTASGTWKASSDKLMGEIDPSTVNINLNSAVIDGGEAAAMRSEIMRELKEGDYIDGGQIRSLTADKLVIYDEIEHEEYTYTKVN